jgi:glycosyltransferase involved in cell wall biosynthesis
MRVLVIAPKLAPNGAIRFQIDLGVELEKLGIEVDLFSVAVGPDQIPHEDSKLPLTVGFPRGVRRRYGFPVMLSRCTRAVRRADLVLSGWEARDGFAPAFLAAKAGRRPIVASVQNNLTAALDRDPPDWASRVTRWGYPRVDAAVCVSHDLVPGLDEMGVRRDKVRVIPCGVHVDRVRALASERGPDSLPDPPLVVGVGRLSVEKGFDLLIEAHARVLNRGCPHTLVIVGSGNRGARELERLAATLGVSDSVLLTGFLKNPFPVLAQASLFCLPSRFEGWGLALAEAIVLGVPAIAADCVAGPADVLEHGRYGELVQPDSVDALAAAIERHLRDPEPLKSKARLAQENAESFSVRSRAAAYASFFEELGRRRRNGAASI